MKKDLHFYKYYLLLSSFLMVDILDGQTFCNPPKTQIHTTVTSSAVTKIQPHGVVAAGNGFWVTGTTTHNTAKLDFLLARFNDSGRLLFLKRMGTTGDETSYPVAIAPTAAGGCVIAGRSDEPAVGCGLAGLAYINRDGTLKWWRRTTSNNNWGSYDAFRNVMVRKDGTVFGCGSSHQWNNNSQLLLAAVDSNGNEIFRNSYRYGAQTHMCASAEMGSGYVVGGHDGQSPVLIMVTSDGVVDKCFGYSSSVTCNISSLTVSPSGKVYVTGGYLVGSNYELWAACVNPTNGNMLWQKRYNLGYCYGGKIDWENNRLLVSFMHNAGGSNWHNGFAELDSNGNVSKVKLIRFSNVSFENHLAGANNARLPGGGMAFVGSNAAASANVSLSLINPCDSVLCSVRNAKFNQVNNTTVLLTSNKGTMYYDGKLATNLNISINNVAFTQTNNCVACVAPRPTRFRDTTLCPAQSAMYKVLDYSVSVLWSDGDTSHVKLINNPGIYRLSLSNACGVYRDTVEVKFLQPMKAILPKKIGVCKGASVSVIGTQPLNFNYIYLWNDGNNNSSRTFNSPGTYILQTTDDCGSRFDTLEISFKSGLKKPGLKDTFSCGTSFIYTQKISDYSLKVIWSDGDTSHNKQFTNFGIYSVTVSDTCGFVNDTFEIFRRFLPIKVIADSVNICRGNVISVDGTQPGNDIYSYKWNNGTTGPIATVRNRSTLVLTTSNSCGSRIDQAEIFVLDCDCEICIPNAFTPGNKDGRNDLFMPRLDCKYNQCTVKESYMRIYNRWGEKLYDAPVTKGWDGTYLGGVVPEGQYVYIIYIIFDSHISGGKIRESSGTFTVLHGD